jgi:hypothetical protein
MNNVFETYKKSTYENISGNMILTIDDVFSDVIYISISTQQAKTPDKMSLSLKSSSVTDSEVELVPSVCTMMNDCSLKIVYDILVKSFVVTGISGMFILKNVPGRPNERSALTSSSPINGYTPFPNSGSSPSSSSQQPDSSIKSAVPFSNFITVTFTVSNSTDWKLDLIDTKSERVIKTFKNTIPLNNNAKEENRRTFQNVEQGTYIVKLVPYSSNNSAGKESTSNQISIGSENIMTTATAAQTASPISGYTPFPSSSPSPMRASLSASPSPSPSFNSPDLSPIQPSHMPMSPL